jgi:hypothetical protein
MIPLQELRLEFLHDWYYASDYGVSKSSILFCYLLRTLKAFLNTIVPALMGICFLAITWDGMEALALTAAYILLIKVYVTPTEWRVHSMGLGVGTLLATSENTYLQLVGVATGTLVANFSLVYFRVKAKSIKGLIASLTLCICWLKFYVFFTLDLHLSLGQKFDPALIPFNSELIHLSGTLLGLSLIAIMTLAILFQHRIERSK